MWDEASRTCIEPLQNVYKGLVLVLILHLKGESSRFYNDQACFAQSSITHYPPPKTPFLNLSLPLSECP